ncbi:MAG TPA: GAF and ANTAR domain-containing protein [Acidimicrobiales bacterium]|nr:GAF and ANTAR domain-containing protein [Acidimicrobiales bacterium]
MEPKQFGADANRLGAVVLADHTLDEIVALLSSVTREAVPAAQLVSLTLLGRNGTPYTAEASDELATALDQVQYSERDGPCLHAVATQESVNVHLDQEAERWPQFVAACTNAGLHSVLSTPFEVHNHLVGAFNVYGSESARFSGEAEQIGRLVVRHGGVLLANAIALHAASTLNEQLHEALATRDLIGQAKGILMARESCDADRAFDILRRASQRSNKKLRDVATEVIRSVQSRLREH